MAAELIGILSNHSMTGCKSETQNRCTDVLAYRYCSPRVCVL